MNLISKIQTLYWFLVRPSHWQQAGVVLIRKFKQDRDTPQHLQRGIAWAKERAVSQEDALVSLGLLPQGEPLLELPAALIEQGRQKEGEAMGGLGGGGDIRLLYTLVRRLPAQSVVETGVAYGWSSLAILQGFEDAGQHGQLISVDMAYPKKNNEASVGVVVPEALRARWTLLRMPDQPGIAKAISELRVPLDLCHFDSDKSWWGRDYAYPRLWKALRPGGVFISDDVQDNSYFSEFMQKLGLPFAVVECEGKFVGLCRKPQ